jgi:hypothetical protein
MTTAWEYLAFRLWNYVEEPLRSGRDSIAAREDSDTGGAAALLSVRGADGWELVAVVPQQDPSAKDGVSYVAYMKRQAVD